MAMDSAKLFYCPQCSFESYVSFKIDQHEQQTGHKMLWNPFPSD